MSQLFLHFLNICATLSHTFSIFTEILVDEPKTDLSWMFLSWNRSCFLTTAKCNETTLDTLTGVCVDAAAEAKLNEEKPAYAFRFDAGAEAT